MVNGQLWANIWLTNDIYSINPDSGEAQEKFNFNELTKEMEKNKGFE